MTAQRQQMRAHAESIWRAAVAAAEPGYLLAEALADRQSPRSLLLRNARRVLVVGAGKAGAPMAAAAERELAGLRGSLSGVSGVVNVPSETVLPLQAVRLHGARPAGSNHPTAEGVAGSEAILELVESAGPEDVALCLISGGGSALLPAPAVGISLDEKQQVTRALHRCGASIQEMNAVRKHLSRIKGGRLASAFRGKALFSLILSDVVGDPLDVIGSGPTAPDSTTFADALAVLDRHQLRSQVAGRVVAYLEAGVEGKVPETPKTLPVTIYNDVIGNNARSLRAAAEQASSLGYAVINLGSYFEGETAPLARALAAVARSIAEDGVPRPAPVCLLSGGETTVTLPQDHGLGGRNQEFSLSGLCHLPEWVLERTVILCGGTDGEDGPTDAAGAFADFSTLQRARSLGLNPTDFLGRHDAYRFFDATGDLLRTGLTHTNVMDVRVLLIG